MGFFKRRRTASAAIRAFDSESPLLFLSPSDPWRIKDAFEGTQIFGATGSGKTSGSGQAIAKAFLKAGFGGLVLTVKPDERTLWEAYARETGRSSSLIVVSPDGPWRFNFLDYEFRRPGAGGGLTENLVMLFCNVIEVADRKSGMGRGEDYWHRAHKQLLRNAIDLAAMAKDRVLLDEIYDVIHSAPQSAEQAESEAWQARSFCYRAILEAERKPKTPSRQRDFDLTAKYWLGEFPALAEKTRSVIVSTFTSMADCFLRGVLADLFCTETTFLPELTHEGAVVILDLPVKEFADVGQFAQVLFKFVWQRATERRDAVRNPRPVFLWADEAQSFVTSSDMQFQTTARSSRAATVYLSQNISNYYAVLGGEKGHAETDALLGNLQTKIFHANGDQVTNQWAAELFAKGWQFIANASTSRGNDAFSAAPFEKDRFQYGAGSSQTLEYEVLPREFTTLRKGGRESGACVDSIIFQAGRVWRATGKNHLRTTFRQGA